MRIKTLKKSLVAIAFLASFAAGCTKEQNVASDTATTDTVMTTATDTATTGTTGTVSATGT